jgi:hypothetical protein
MITIPEVVEANVKHSPFLEEGIAQGIINFSALARIIKAQVEEETMKEVTEGAIVMALKRLAPKLKQTNQAKKIFQNPPDMIVRSNLIEYTLANSETLIKKHKRILEEMGEINKYFFVLTQGVFETTVILSKDLKPKIEAIFAGEKLISTIEKLSAITIRLPEESITTTGVHYFIDKALAWENINIVEVASTYSEFTIILKENDVDKAFSILKKALS